MLPVLLLGLSIILPTWGFEFGANGGLPYVNITVNDFSYNIFWFMENTTVRTIIHWMRDLFGMVIVGTTIIRLVKNFPLIIQGQYNFIGPSYVGSELTGIEESGAYIEDISGGSIML